MNHNALITEDVNEVLQNTSAELKRLEGKTILMSGGAGFLGSYIVATLLAANKKLFRTPCRVIVLDNYITGSRKNSIFDASDPNFQFIEHNVCLPLPEHLTADYVIHAAGLASPYYYRKFPLETIDVTVNGTKNFLEFFKDKKIKGLLYFSSSEIYGDPHPDFIPTPEEYWGHVSCTGPRACYDESKRLGETLCKTYFELFGLPVKVVRPFNVYGPGMKVNDFRVIPTFTVNLLGGNALLVHDKGTQTRTFCYITDAIQGFLKTLVSGRPGETYNIGMDNEEVDMMTLANTLAKLHSREAEVRLASYPESYPAAEPKRRCPDITKARTELNFKPRVDLKTGLARTMSWYRTVLGETPDEPTVSMV